MTTPRILAFAGSLRKDSWNKKLVQIAVQGAREAGAETQYIDLRDYALPIFDEDLEKGVGMPANGKKLKQLFKEHDGFLISAPEYNSSITAVLKNTIDWVSRPEKKDEPALAAFTGKAAALMSASPGALGGLRGLVHLRAILGNINVLLLPEQVAIPKAHEAFSADGALKDAAVQERVKNLGRNLATLLGKLKA